jgi:hypothetical protein
MPGGKVGCERRAPSRVCLRKSAGIFRSVEQTVLDVRTGLAREQLPLLLHSRGQSKQLNEAATCAFRRAADGDALCTYSSPTTSPLLYAASAGHHQRPAAGRPGDADIGGVCHHHWNQ